MSPALLSQRLKELEAAGIVARAASGADPAVSEYRLTELGRDLGPLVEAFGIGGSAGSNRSYRFSISMWIS